MGFRVSGFPVQAFGLGTWAVRAIIRRQSGINFGFGIFGGRFVNKA